MYFTASTGQMDSIENERTAIGAHPQGCIHINLYYEKVVDRGDDRAAAFRTPLIYEASEEATAKRLRG